MTKSAAFALGLIVLLAGCAPEEEESVEERFKRTEAAIENTAAALQAETANAVRETESRLENQADAVANSLETANVTGEEEPAANSAR